MSCIEREVLNTSLNNTPDMVAISGHTYTKERTITMDRAIKRGDLVYLNFDPIIGSEQGGPRPAVVVQNDIGNKHSPTVIIAPVTSKTKKTNLPTHVRLTSKCLERYSMVLLEQIKTIDKSRIASYIGTLTDEEMKMIEKALRISLGMGRYKKKRG